MCIMVFPPAFSQWKNAGTGGVDLLSILIRDSLLWYFCLGGCLLLNALFFTTGKPILGLIGIPATQAASTIGGARLLINLRAAYFLPTRNPTSTLAGFPRDTGFIETRGTVGRFRPALEDEGHDGEEDCAASIGIGVWANAESPVHHDRPGSPSLILLQPVPLEGRGRRARSAPGSSCAGLREPGDGGGLGLEVSVSDLSEPAHAEALSLK